CVLWLNARTYMLKRRQQCAVQRRSRGSLAYQKHRRISCDRDHLHNALCRCAIGSEADSSPSHSSRNISSRSDAGDEGGLDGSALGEQGDSRRRGHVPTAVESEWLWLRPHPVVAGIGGALHTALVQTANKRRKF